MPEQLPEPPDLYLAITTRLIEAKAITINGKPHISVRTVLRIIAQAFIKHEAEHGNESELHRRLRAGAAGARAQAGTDGTAA